MKIKFKHGIFALLLIASGFFVGFRSSNPLFEVSKNLEIFNSLFRELHMYYVDEPEPGKLMKVGIDAILSELDPYTNYIPESKIEDYRFMTTGKYGGIGALIRKIDSSVFIAEPYTNGPAAKSGLRAGDILLEVEGKKVTGLNVAEVSDLLKGKAGTPLKIKFNRNGENKTASFNREEIKIPDVPYSGIYPGNIGYIKLNSFTETASSEVKKSFEELKSKGMKKLVFDLRGNGGGLLNEAVKIVNFFVPKGKEIVSVKGRIKDWDRTHLSRNEPLDTLMPLVVLVDGSSASASEIVSGALQDYDRAVIIGNTTYGKGLVQQTKDLSYNSKLKLTIGKYYIPSGRCIQKIDYKNREVGSNATVFADSLLRVFKTTGGRPFQDGRGISPDIEIKEEFPQELLQSLYEESSFFLFMNQFSGQKTLPSNWDKFEFSDADFNAFMSYLKRVNFDYQSTSERQLMAFKASIEKDEVSAKTKSMISELEREINEDQLAILQRNSHVLKRLLRNEWVSRHHFQVGRIKDGLRDDPFFLKAQEVLNDSPKMKSILSVSK